MSADLVAEFARLAESQAPAFLHQSQDLAGCGMQDLVTGFWPHLLSRRCHSKGGGGASCATAPRTGGGTRVGSLCSP